MKRSTGRAGATLIELLIVVAIVGIVAAVAVLAPHRAPAPDEGSVAEVTQRARRQALNQARVVTVDVVVAGSVRTFTAFPDGSVAADTEFHIGRIDIAPPRVRQ